MTDEDELVFRNGLFQENDQCCLRCFGAGCDKFRKMHKSQKKRGFVDKQVAKSPKIVTNILEKELLQSQLTSKELTRLLRTGDGQLSSKLMCYRSEFLWPW